MFFVVIEICRFFKLYLSSCSGKIIIIGVDEGLKVEVIVGLIFIKKTCLESSMLSTSHSASCKSITF